MMLQFIAALVLGLMFGSELNVAAFADPMLNRQPLAVHIPVRSSFAAQLGRVMAFVDGRFDSLEPAPCASNV